jgi:small multidrug resistance pump
VPLSGMPWIFPSVAILFEVAGTTSMKLSRGFAEMWPSVGVFVFYFCSAVAVILALRRLELSIAYAIWSGVGTALTAMIGIVYFPRAANHHQACLNRTCGHRCGRLESCRQGRALSLQT